MLVLIVDTAGSSGGVLLARSALAGETEILGESGLEPREFSRQLLFAIAEIFERNRLELSDLDAFSVVSGPGSFTGLRVGLSAVKAMAEVTTKPVIAVSRLAMMAASVNHSSAVHAVLDAGRGEFYHGIYREAGRVCVMESLETSASLLAGFERVSGLVVTSEPAVFALLSALPDLTLQQISFVGAREALPLALEAWQAGNFCDVASLDANYLRRIEPAVAGKNSRVSETTGLQGAV